MNGPYCSYATKDGVHVLFSGEVSEWPGINVVESAHDGELVRMGAAISSVPFAVTIKTDLSCPIMFLLQPLLGTWLLQRRMMRTGFWISTIPSGILTPPKTMIRSCKSVSSLWRTSRVVLHLSFMTLSSTGKGEPVHNF